ncbi:tungstate ABC transporter ATP-binding protein TupC [Campylobacter molothri]|uniref:tungstate ABC transporter ATP-binding protein TupC n=1 Tax=Campylobacter molothri TaxID=1032242 RepID=UPI001EFAF56C|nr:tungstate ABC transporter ATP-binding protein TupC [Campylobacter sp. RM10537]MBZ7928556.1 ABC transporter ATP-binding protein [Campylobacter sp. RM10542]MBZ7943653.1 ABC transporter ATP-binding protein [Campylobacter sp. RM13744]ULO00345.1 tungsten ABC transporter TupABC, ATP-binding protein [Campylobacter sp. RM10537]
MIELNNFNFNYDQKNILNIKKLVLDTNKISILMGLNGSGKSTLLRILKFLEGDFENISYFGKTHLNSDEKRQIYLLFPEPVFLNRSIEKNFLFLLKTYKIDLKEIKNRIDETFNLLEIDKNLLKKHPNELSSGQSQKLAFALALSVRAKYYLLDEPSAFLDQKTAILLKKAILFMQKTYKSGFLIASHDKVFLDSLAQKRYYLHSGEILEFENTNVFDLENKGIYFDRLIDFSSYMKKNSSKIAINPYKIFFIKEKNNLNHDFDFIIYQCLIIALRTRKDFVFVRIKIQDKILEFALSQDQFSKSGLNLYDEIILTFNQDAIYFLD